MDNEDIVAMIKLVQELFTDEQIVGMLVGTLMHIYKDDKEKIVTYLAYMKDKQSDSSVLH